MKDPCKGKAPSNYWADNLTLHKALLGIIAIKLQDHISMSTVQKEDTRNNI